MDTMRKIVLGFIAFSLMAISLNAQDDPGKAYKNATRDLSTYNLDPQNNLAKLQEAKAAIDVAITGNEEKMDARVWNSRAEIYNALVSNEVNRLYIDQSHVLPPELENYAVEAMKSARKAMELADKKYMTKDALTNLTETGRYFSAIGNQRLQTSDYAGAYKPMKFFLDVDAELRANGADPLMESDIDVSNQQFVTAFCAHQAGDDTVAKNLLHQLYEKDHSEPLVYSMYFDILIKEENEAEAMRIMEAGKAKFPGNTELLISEINFFLRENRLDELVGKLQMAIDKEPTNVSLYTTLGSVYDQLFQRELSAGNEELSTKYFNEALKFFNQALEREPDFADAIYSIGALYYNKAAATSQEMKALEDDISKEGLKRYNEKKDEMYGYFDKALPYFEKVEAMNPNDQNTLIALKEIFAKKDDIELSNEFKRRLEVIQEGGSNEKSYFKL
jgi:tetratricopeptide (TPR) repeat protein